MIYELYISLDVFQDQDQRIADHQDRHNTKNIIK